MKKIIVLITILLVLILSGCNDNVAIGHDNIVLPNLSGMNKTEIISLFDNLGHPVLFEYSTEENEIYSNTFVEYENFSYGDIVNETDEIIIILYPIYMGVVSYIELPNLEGLEKDEIINIKNGFLNSNDKITKENLEKLKKIIKKAKNYNKIKEYFEL